MELFIRIVNGQPFEHPIFGDNFRQAFPDVDVDNLPPEFAKFERVEKPNLNGLFEIEEVFYQWVNGVVKDVWVTRQMNEEEKQQTLADMTYSANDSVERMKVIAQKGLESATTDVVKQAWVNYLAELNAWTLIDPVNPNIPVPPLVKPDGTVLTTNTPGSTPNVIG